MCFIQRSLSAPTSPTDKDEGTSGERTDPGAGVSETQSAGKKYGVWGGRG